LNPQDQLKGSFAIIGRESGVKISSKLTDLIIWATNSNEWLIIIYQMVFFYHYNYPGIMESLRLFYLGMNLVIAAQMLPS